MSTENQNLQTLNIPPKQEGPEWEQIGHTLKSSRWFILTVTAVVFAATSIWMVILPDIYSAQTNILVEKIEESVLDYKEILSPTGESGPAFYETKVALLKSRPILEQTVQQLGLVEYYAHQNRKVKTAEDAVKVLRKRLRANVMGRTQIIKLEVNDTDPEWAAKIANTISENFVKESWKERFYISDQLLKWFPDQASTLQQNTPIHQLQELQDNDVINSLPSVMQDSILNGIKQDRLKLDAEIREYSKRYTEEHPKMKELKARAEYLEGEFRLRVQKIVSGLKAGLAGEFGVNSIRVIETATAPTLPSGPKRVLTIVGSTVFTLVLSTWLSIFMSFINRNIRSEDDVRNLSIPFLGYLPVLTQLKDPKKHGPFNLLNIMDVDHRLLDHITNIRTSLLFSMPAERSKLILCTSTLPAEGKTTVASLLATSLADFGLRVLLVDADMRNPSIHKLFGMENREGLSACLVGAAKFTEVLSVIEKKPKLHLITAGKRPPNPVVLLSSASMEAFISEVYNEYDKVIFDAPPSLHMADAAILAGRMHGVMIVINDGVVHQKAAHRMLERLRVAQGFILGAVLNRARYEKVDYNYYHYYDKYSKYYQPSAR